MIVKNESKVIRRLLSSVVNLIDSYCICDTGSTDNTVDLIETFFREHDIPGKITREPFRDFAHNRSFSLKAAEDLPADYILLLDADMVLQLHEDVDKFKQSLTKDYYHIFQGSDAFYHKNTRIIKNRIGASYWGVTHEYVKTPEGATFELLDKSRVFIHDIGDGGAKADKFERDIRLLKQGLVDYPNNDRYTFYLANSYKDHGDNELAIETYKKRIELGGWMEEVWYSYYNIGRCYRNLGDMVNAVHWWLEAYQYFPKRIENLYEIITYYRGQGKPQLAYLFYCMALKQLLLHPTPDYLFLQKDVYEYKLNYEFSIIGYYCNVDGYDMPRICLKVLNCPYTEDSIARNVLSNYKFYAKTLKSISFPMEDRVQKVLKSIGSAKDGFFTSTPSLCWMGKDRLAVCVRYVNYYINERGGYENKQNIETRNRLAIIDTRTWMKLSEWDMEYDRSLDGLYVGLEDVRLFNHGGTLLYNANRGLGRHKILVEHGQVIGDCASNNADHGQVIGDCASNNDSNSNSNSDSNQEQQTSPRSGLIFAEGQKDVEKNWVLFEDANGQKKCIYGWSDLTIGDLVQNPVEYVESESEPDSDDEDQVVRRKPGDFFFRKTHSIPSPALFRQVRGSTNGIRVNDEIWFMVHLVSYEDRRYYYHMIIALDPATYAIRRYTTPFTLEGEKVEYTLGFVHEPDMDSFLVGYSKMDRSTEFIRVFRHAIEGWFVENSN